jgi:Peptidase inhibitor family I36
MSNINNQTQDLYSIELVQDVDHEAAATVSGGALILWSGFNATGNRRFITAADSNLGRAPGVTNFNNVASSYRVTLGQRWAAYTGFNFTGRRFVLSSSTLRNFPSDRNNVISSVRRIS